MSQVYSISLKVGYTSEEGAKQVLQKRIANGKNEHVNYSLDHYREDIGLDMDNVHDLVRMIFGGWHARFDRTSDPDWVMAGFNASYGWESVMMDAFTALAPFLTEGSEIVIDVDEGVDHAIVKDGKAVWLQ